MAEVVALVLPGFSARLVEVDVREDPELERRYVFEIPVLLLGDAEIARHRTTPEELRRKLTEAGVAATRRSGT
jgi:hypothetical protein